MDGYITGKRRGVQHRALPGSPLVQAAAQLGQVFFPDGKSRRWHAEDLQPLCAKLGEEQTGKTLVAVAALEQVGLITAAEKGGAKFWELVPTAGKKNLGDAPILKCLEEL